MEIMMVLLSIMAMMMMLKASLDCSSLILFLDVRKFKYAFRQGDFLL